MNPKYILFILTINLISFSLSPQDVWSPKELMKIKSINQTDISNDGKYIAYVVREAIMTDKKSEFLSQIWVSNTGGSQSIQYTFNEKSSTSPKFSPDGNKIAFLSSRSGKNQIWIMNTLGGEAKKLTDEKKGVRSIKWSPDGNNISFLKNDNDTEEETKSKKIRLMSY